TTVEFDPEQAKGIDTEADRALGEAGLEGGDKALAPGLGVVGVVLVVAVEIGVAQQQIEVGVLDETLGFGLAAGVSQRPSQREAASQRETVFLVHGCSGIGIVLNAPHSEVRPGPEGAPRVITPSADALFKLTDNYYQRLRCAVALVRR